MMRFVFTEECHLNPKKVVFATFTLLFWVALSGSLFTACKGDDDPEVVCQDADGNVYETKSFGNQVWMTENLKTTKYYDGTSLTYATGSSSWANQQTGAYCNYDNNEDSATRYGRLYNWYAVSAENLCPEGWHIPSRDEWTELVEYLISKGYNYDGSLSEDKTAKSLAAASGWASFTIAGTVGYEMSLNNTSGFTALPGGARGSTGACFDAGEYGYWWSTTENADNTDEAYYRVLSSFWSDFYESTSDKNAGFAVRCVKD
jgi:uncharacterized protein (TIGR02145 family)